MKKGSYKKALCALMALMICIGATACGAQNAETSSTDTSSNASDTSTPESGDAAPSGDGEQVTLTFLTLGAGLPQEEQSLVVQEIAKKTGVFVQTNIVAEDKWNVLMASGDLGADIISPQTIHQQQLVEGNLIIPLDDLVSKLGPDIQKTAANSLDYWKQYKSFGKNQLFFIPSHNAPDIKEVTDSVPYAYGVAPYIRWDYYEELGSPEVKNEDDFLNMLKQMQDKHPTNADGKKTYAISMEVASSPLWVYNTFYSYYNDREMVNWMLSRDSTFELKDNALQEDFIGWRAAAYYNKAYRLGIFDPETFTQKGENVTQKITSGQSFYTENNWNSFNQVLGETVGPQAGFEPLLEAFPTAYAGGTSRFGWGFTTSIASSCKNPEAAMKWINFIYSEEGARLLYSGVEGTHWSYDANKVPSLTDETVAKYQDEEWNKANGLRKFHNMIGIDNMIKHSDGYAVDLFQTPEMLVKSNKAIDTKYSQKYGATYPGEVGKILEKQGKTKVIWWIGDNGSLMPTMPDDISRIVAKTDDAMIKGFPKMIMAKTPEEFEKEKLALIKQLESLGAKTVIDWATTEYNASKEKIGSLK